MCGVTFVIENNLPRRITRLALACVSSTNVTLQGTTMGGLSNFKACASKVRGLFSWGGTVNQTGGPKSKTPQPETTMGGRVGAEG